MRKLVFLAICIGLLVVGSVYLYESGCVAELIIAVAPHLRWSISSEPDKRPRNIPLDAVWSGGPDGGAFFQCRAIPHQPLSYHCRVYGNAGDLQAEAAFRLEKGPAIADLQDPRTYNGWSWDGETIYLSDDRELRH